MTILLIIPTLFSAAWPLTLRMPSGFPFLVFLKYKALPLAAQYDNEAEPKLKYQTSGKPKAFRKESGSRFWLPLTCLIKSGSAALYLCGKAHGTENHRDTEHTGEGTEKVTERR